MRQDTLLDAVKTRDMDKMREMLAADNKAEMNPALCEAALKAYYEFVGPLIEAGADVNYNDGRALACLALDGSNRGIDTAALLMSHGAVVNKDILFLNAITCNNVRFVELLLNNGAVIGNFGDVLIRAAVGWGCEDIVTMLLDHWELTAAMKENLLLHAAEGSHVNMVHLLLDRGWYEPDQISNIWSNMDERPSDAIERIFAERGGVRSAN